MNAGGCMNPLHGTASCSLGKGKQETCMQGGGRESCNARGEACNKLVFA